MQDTGQIGGRGRRRRCADGNQEVSASRAPRESASAGRRSTGMQCGPFRPTGLSALPDRGAARAGRGARRLPRRDHCGRRGRARRARQDPVNARIGSTGTSLVRPGSTREAPPASGPARRRRPTAARRTGADRTHGCGMTGRAIHSLTPCRAGAFSDRRTRRPRALFGRGATRWYRRGRRGGARASGGAECWHTS